LIEHSIACEKQDLKKSCSLLASLPSGNVFGCPVDTFARTAMATPDEEWSEKWTLRRGCLRDEA
jgi:hypothetical protein